MKQRVKELERELSMYKRQLAKLGEADPRRSEYQEGIWAIEFVLANAKTKRAMRDLMRLPFAIMMTQREAWAAAATSMKPA